MHFWDRGEAAAKRSGGIHASELESGIDDQSEARAQFVTPSLFIGSSAQSLPIARELGKQLGGVAAVTLWSEGAFQPGRTVIESLMDVGDRCDFAAFLVTSDDLTSRREPRSLGRSNLIFELGFLLGRIGAARTFVIAEAEAALPSDLAGVVYIPFSERGQQSAEAVMAPAAALIRRTISGMPTRQRPVSYYSCFISYSWTDRDFATKLYDDLHEVGVRCWLDAKDMRAGDLLTQQIDQAIQIHDKILLILSRASVGSEWVRFEIRNAMRRESKRRTAVLFPLRLDDAVLETSDRDFDVLRERYIIDFTEWQDKSAYRRAFKRLVRDLSISASVEIDEAR